MKERKSIILVIFVVIVLVAIAIIFIYKYKPIPKETLRCANSGESIGSCVGCLSNCCSGLKPLNMFIINGECVNFSWDGSPGVICSNCGNKICDVENSENSCNCPEDCK